MEENLYKEWSEKEKRFLKDNCKTMSNEELAKTLGRTARSVSMEKYKLRLTKVRKFVTDKEIDFIKANTGKLTYRQMAKELNRPLSTVYATARRVFPKRNIRNDNLWGRYTEDEVRFLEVNWRSMSIFELAETLNKTPKSIVYKLLREGLLDDDE